MEILLLVIITFLLSTMTKMGKSKGFKLLSTFIILSVLLMVCSANSDDIIDLNNSNNDVEDTVPSEDNSANLESLADSKSDNVNGDKESSLSDSSSVDSKDSLSEMKVHFIDVGQADAALIQYDNHNILIDTGDWQGNETVSYLKSNNVKKLDLVVGSHPHADHIGQMDKVLNSFEVDEVWMSGGIATSQLFERVLTAIENSNASYNEPRADEKYKVGSLDIEIFGPTSITGNLNDDSIVMRLTYGDVSFMFTGDAEIAGETKIVNSGKNLKSTILKAGHHGSDTSTTQPFLDKVNPEVVVVSVAEKSKYNHPNKTVIDRINNHGATLYATKTHGNIVISTDGKDYSVKTQSEGNVSPGDTGKSAQSTSKSGPASNSKPAGSESKSISQSQTNSTATTSPIKKPAESTGGCVNINTASKVELQEIKHIGEGRADLVIKQRDVKQFDSIDDLSRIKGIGNGVRLAEIKEENVACVR